MNRNTLQTDSRTATRRPSGIAERVAPAKPKGPAPEPGWLRAVREGPEELFRTRVRHWYKREAGHRVAAVTLTTPNGDLCAVCKCIEPVGFLGKIRDWFGRSRVRHAWLTGHALLRNGIATPEPLLFVDGGLNKGSRQYLLTAAIENAATISQSLRALWPELTPAKRRAWMRHATCRLAEQIHRLHLCGYDHRDLKFDNILVSDAAVTNNSLAQTWILDLDAVRHWPWLPQARAIQNLSRLNVSSLVWPMFRNTDRLRFLKHYLGESFDAKWKAWWRAIAGRSLQKQRQNRRRGRVLS